MSNNEFLRPEAKIRVVIPNPSNDPVGSEKVFYTNFYKDHTDDSPEGSRLSLIKRARPLIETLEEGEWVLDVGAGRQILEKEYLQNYPAPKAKILTFDIADLKSEQLLAEDKENVFHIRGNGARLPFPDESISLAISNMAFDFMPKKARSELFRVTKPGASILFNLHHSSLVSTQNINSIEEHMRKLSRKIFMHGDRQTPKVTSLKKEHKMAGDILIHRDYLKKSKKLSDCEEQVRQTFQRFEIQKVALGQNINGTWWEVDMKKPLSTR
jgi:ubiquinone/menaquinone biosynthesis C-methylase UbiE